MDILGQSALLVGVTSFALGFSTLSRNVRNKLFLAFALLTTVISFWSTCFFLEKVWPHWSFYRWHLFFNVWLAPFALLFIRQMVRVHDWLSRRLFEASLVLAAGLTGAMGLRFDFTPVGRQAIYYAPIFVFLQILYLMWLDRRVRVDARRVPKTPMVGLKRRNLIYFGGLLVLCTSVMDHVPWMPTAIPCLGNIALTAYIFFISQAISQQRLLNLGALLSRFLVLLAVALTLTAIYSMLVAWIENSPGLFFLNSFIASFVILMLLDPLRAAVGYFTWRLLSPKHRKLEETLDEASRGLLSVVEPQALFGAILATTEQTLGSDRAALYVLRSDGTRYRRAMLTGAGEPAFPAEMIADHILLQRCRKLQKKGELPILLDQLLESEAERSASRAQKLELGALVQGLRGLKCNLLIPLFDADSDSILGFVALHAEAPPEAWGSNWGLLRIVYPYYLQAGAVLRSMEVFTRQREKERLATLGEMAAGLAHEIRNPLGAIKGAAQFLDPAVDRPESRFLHVIVEEVDRLNRVVTRFLDYSKPPVTDFRLVGLEELAQKTVENLRPSLPAGVILRFQDDGRNDGVDTDSKMTCVMASAEQLQQVLINLIQNSAKACQGRARAEVTVSVESSGGAGEGAVSLVVEDTGPGIKREHLDKLFIPFFTTSPGGTGLGLSISQKLIEAHGGRIEVATEEGRFARFSVILPKPSTNVASGKES